MKRTLFLSLFLGLFIHVCDAQVSFNGFEQDQCGLITDHGYTFENIPMMCGSHSSGYTIYLDGAPIFEKCIEFGGCSLLELMFVNKTTGFIVERNPNGHTVYKTENSGVNWLSIGSGAPGYLGFYLVNENTGYLITTWNSPLNLYINRVSDIHQSHFSDPNINQDIEINDTIFGACYCPTDYLRFEIENSGEIIGYKIVFIVESLSVQELILNRKVEFYPNPGVDFVFIEEEAGMESFNYRIIELSGRTIKSGESINRAIYIGDLSNGVYLMQLSNDDNAYFGKLIKH